MARLGVPGERPLFWIGDSKAVLMGFPEKAIDAIGSALGVAQFGGKHPAAKPWKGEGPGVFEIVEDQMGDTYRAVYTIRFAHAIYVLHAFQKKSPKGIRTDRRDVETISRRLKLAMEYHEVQYGKKK